MNVITLTEPAVEPVTLEQVYSHLRITPDPDSPLSHPDDAMLTRQLVSARKDCENTTRRSFVRQKLRLVVDPCEPHWPWAYGFSRYGYLGRARGNWWGAEHLGGRRGIELKRPQVQEVVAVSYYGADNVLVVIDPANYYLTDDEPARLFFIQDFTAPAVYARPDALRIDYWAGYPTEGSPADDFISRVPQPIKSAILIGVELQYDQMSPAQRSALEQTQLNLLGPYIVPLGL